MAGRGRGSIAGFDSDSETEIQEIGMDLEQLGYHEFFQTAFAVFDGSGLIPGRVASATHGIYGIWTGDGPVQAETSGRFEFTAASRLDYPVIGDWVAKSRAQANGSTSRGSGEVTSPWSMSTIGLSGMGSSAALIQS